MISAVDSSIILDVVTGDPRHADPSEEALRRASREGQVIACECVLAEVYPVFDGTDSFEEFLTDWQVDFVPSSRQSAILAGRHFAAYLARGGSRRRVAADFLIGAHAQTQADRLVARDRGFLRDYFSGLQLLDPSSGA